MAYTVPFTFVAGTTIFSAQVNTNFSTGNSNLNAHEVATTAVHGVGAGAIVGTTLPQVLTNKTFATPTITGNLNLNSGAQFRMYSDVGVTLKFAVDGATGSFGIPATQKFYLDGTGLSGDTYLTEGSANSVSLITGGATSFSSSVSTFSIGSLVDLSISSTKKFYIDGVGDTYIYESSANTISFVAGGTQRMALSTLFLDLSSNIDLVIYPTKKLYLDGGGDTFLREVSANSVQLITGGSTAFNSSSGLFELGAGADFSIFSTKKLYLDGGTNDYWTNSANGQNDLYAAGTLALRTTSSGGVNFPNYILNTGGFSSNEITPPTTDGVNNFGFATVQGDPVNLRYKVNCYNLTVGNAAVWSSMGGFTGTGDVACNGHINVTIDGVARKLMTTA